MVPEQDSVTPQELKSFFQSGSQLWDIGPNDTRLPMGWGKLRKELLEEGFTKSELKRYVRAGLIGETLVQPSKGKTIVAAPQQVMFYWKTDELIRQVTR